MKSRFNHPDPIIQEHARDLRRSLAPPEALLWAKLRDRQLGNHKFRRQHPIGRYVADFYSPASHLVIELDGDSHVNQVEYDQHRTNHLEANGYRVLRFTNRDVVNSMEGVLLSILQACAEGESVSPSP